MRYALGVAAALVAVLFAVVSQDQGRVFADQESDCDNLPNNIGTVHWSNPGPLFTKNVDSDGLDIEFDDIIVWCYGDDPDFGSFENLSSGNFNILNDDVDFSPLYYYPSTHYGTVTVTVTAELATAADGEINNRVNQIYPYSSSDRDVDVDYVP